MRTSTSFSRPSGSEAKRAAASFFATTCLLPDGRRPAGLPTAGRPAHPRWIKRGSANLHISRMMIGYDQFRDLRGLPPGSVPPGSEPLYKLNANVYQLFLSFWF